MEAVNYTLGISVLIIAVVALLIWLIRDAAAIAGLCFIVSVIVLVVGVFGMTTMPETFSNPHVERLLIGATIVLSISIVVGLTVSTET